MLQFLKNAQNSKSLESPKKLSKEKKKHSNPLDSSANSWSCWADSNCRPHPYQYVKPDLALYSFVSLNPRKSLQHKGLRVIACWPILPCRTPSVGRFVGKYILTPAEGLMALLCGGYAGAPLYFSNSSKVKPVACVI